MEKNVLLANQIKPFMCEQIMVNVQTLMNYRVNLLKKKKRRYRRWWLD